jgi:hypothetical protein
MPEECGSAAALETEVRSRVGVRADAILAETRLTIFLDGEQYRLWMQVGTETREFRDPDCRHLFDAAVVVAASLAGAPAARAPESAAPPAAPSAAVTAPPNEARPTDTRERPSTGLVIGGAVGLGTNFGFLPDPSFNVELAGSVAWEAWGIAVRGRYLSPGSGADAAGHRVDVQAAGAELAATFTAWDLLEVRAGMNVRAAFGSGHGSSLTNGTDTAWSFAPVIGAWAFPLKFGKTWLGVGGDLALDLSPPRFEVIGYGNVFRSEPVDGSVFVGVGHRFR